MRIPCAAIAMIGLSFFANATTVRRGAQQGIPCISASDDTLTLTALSENSRRIGSLTLWSDRNRTVHYVESWRLDTTTYRWEGDVEIGESGLPRTIATRTSRNGGSTSALSVQRNGDSIVTVRNGARAAAFLDPELIPLPSFRSAPLLALLAQCALARPHAELRTSALGTVRVGRIGAADFVSGARRQSAALYVLASDSLSQVAALWLDTNSHRLVAMRGAEGVMNFVQDGLESAIHDIAAAELRAARPQRGPATCAGGNGVGSCEPIGNACQHDMAGSVRRARTFTITDSGYAIRSDGLGAYRTGEANVNAAASPTFGVLMLQAISRVARRGFLVDLSHPVPGDISVPLGVLHADGSWLGPFVPSDGAYRVEVGGYAMRPDLARSIAAHPKSSIRTLDSLIAQNPDAFTDIPVGATVPASFIALDFYLNGLHHVLQAGPLPWGTCSTEGVSIYGEGTTTGTISRPSATSLVIDLPPGSIARLFDVHIDERQAVNRGLYYVSLHAVVQQ